MCLIVERTESEEDEENWRKTKEWIVDGVFCECNKGKDNIANEGVSPDDPQDTQSNNQLQMDDEDRLRRSNETLTIEDFRYCLYRSPDFINTFSFNL